MIEGGQVKAFGLSVADGHVARTKQAVVVGRVFEVDDQLGVVFAQEVVQDGDVWVMAPADRQ